MPPDQDNLFEKILELALKDKLVLGGGGVVGRGWNEVLVL